MYQPILKLVNASIIRLKRLNRYMYSAITYLADN